MGKICEPELIPPELPSVTKVIWAMNAPLAATLFESIHLLAFTTTDLVAGST